MASTWEELTTNKDVSEEFIAAATPYMAAFIVKKYPEITKFMNHGSGDHQKIVQELDPSDSCLQRIVKEMLIHCVPVNIIQRIICAGEPMFKVIKIF